jgi:hypothetical protein
MKRIIAGLAVAVTAASLAACGSAEEGGKPDTAAQAEAAKAKIEQAAHVTLAAGTVPADAREPGLEASYSNAATVVKDKQVVGLFVVKDADLAGEVSAQVRKTAPKAAKLIVDGNVLVVYAPAGDDRSTAIEQAVKAL